MIASLINYIVFFACFGLSFKISVKSNSPEKLAC